MNHSDLEWLFRIRQSGHIIRGPTRGTSMVRGWLIEERSTKRLNWQCLSYAEEMQGNSMADTKKASGGTFCLSCGRSSGPGPNAVEVVTDGNGKWCARCARVERSPDGKQYVVQPSPGRMAEALISDPLDAWIDCYEMTPKRRISASAARIEIQRAWSMWDGDKSANQATSIFYDWLQRHRPYFLTFECKDDRRQRVHAWLKQYETINRSGP